MPTASKTEFTIGKDPSNDIIISDLTSSPFHAKIKFSDGTFVLEDSEPMSKYGTLVGI